MKLFLCTKRQQLTITKKALGFKGYVNLIVILLKQLAKNAICEGDYY